MPERDPDPSRPAGPAIVVEGARTHNLKGVSCRIPHGAVTVVTGPSGAGKSSLAFDTVYAEGQRRFVESMSTYARQFLDKMERPPVDDIRGILPAVAIEARNGVRNARSTVGTITEALDVLRLLFTHLGEVRCPHGHGPLRRYTPDQAAAALAGGAAGESFLLVVRLPRPKRGADQALAELVRQGFSRRLGRKAAEEGAVVRMEPGESWPKAADPLPLVLGRFAAAPAGEAPSARLAETVEEGYRLGAGALEALTAPPGPRPGAAPRRRIFARSLVCTLCGHSSRAPTPALFSFNSPLGACPECQGFGRVIGIDRERVIPNPRLTLEERPIAPWNTPAYEHFYASLRRAARAQGVPLDLPWEELSEADRAWVWSGREGGGVKFTSLERFFKRLERKTYRVHVRVLLARYRAYDRCPGCAGTRLKPEALTVRLEERSIAELAEMSVERLREWLAARDWTPRQRETAGHLIDELAERVEVLHRVGLDYLTLDRQARTLSGGEAQRIHLAASLGSGLTSTLYALDEPTVGLHPQDSGRLLALLHDLAGRGNTVLVVEHDRAIVLGADHVIDLGPRAGEAGGRLMAEGTVEEVLAAEDSLTARYLKARPPGRAREHIARFRRERGKGTLEDEIAGRPRLRIAGARAHNLRGIDVEWPLASLVAVTGVSGSGKSTLVENVLYGTYQRARGVVDVEPGEVGSIEGLEGLADVTLVDQSPLGRSSRSNPVTYVKAYDEIRKLFAAVPGAKARGVTAGHFSFNVAKGRCPACEGTGATEVDMQFMAPVTVPCEECGGRRFRPEVLKVRFQGRSIDQVLDLTVAEAQELFAGNRKLARRLEVLAEAGLGYLRLGQPTSTLSGGEAQRLKLAAFLDRPAAEKPRLFLFDEPTTGLHLSDIDLLCSTLRRLVRRGDGVVVVEHSVDLIARADWIVDLGPGGGVHGGELLYSGPLEGFLDEVESPTAEELRKHLGWRRR
ncbi:MAG TPA: excinuclease ABC subunit UvrA, partial [Thermoanaerobaculia bacterium]|nr:excinuclease ABC subunit UvrA [Thermoanaerobaculia bacterium]